MNIYKLMSTILCKYVNNIFIKASLNLKNNDSFVNNINLLRKLLSRDYQIYMKRQISEDVNQIYQSFDIKTRHFVFTCMLHTVAGKAFFFILENTCTGVSPS